MNLNIIKNNIYDVIYNNGIIVTDVMSLDAAEELHEFLKQFATAGSCIMCDALSDEDTTRYVIRFCNKRFIDIPSLQEEEHRLAQNKKYKEAYEINLRLLNTRRPGPGVYGAIGFYLASINKDKEALSFLTVASLLGKKYNRFDSDKYNSKIIELHSRIEDKPVLKDDDLDFTTYKNEFLNNELVKKIINEIYYGVSTIDKEKEKYNLDVKQYCLILINLARICYADDLVEYGNFYLDKVSRVKNKGKDIEREVRFTFKDRKFYRNRKEEFIKLLVRKSN